MIATGFVYEWATALWPRWQKSIWTVVREVLEKRFDGLLCWPWYDDEVVNKWNAVPERYDGWDWSYDL